MNLTLIKWALGLAAVAIVLGALWAGVSAFNRLRAEAAAYGDCRAQAGVKGGKATTPPACAPELAQAVQRGQAAAACDAGLGKADAGGFTVQKACSAPVKRLVAERDAAMAEVTDRDTTIDQLKADRTAVVARAEARGQTQARRDANAQKVLSAAPRTAGGDIACDADCLSALAGDSPGA
jgi:hypothetical protein